MRSALNSSAVWELTAEGERLFHCGIVRGKKEFFRASLYVWYLQNKKHTVLLSLPMFTLLSRVVERVMGVVCDLFCFIFAECEGK